MIKILIFLLLSAPLGATEKEALGICLDKAMIASTTQQTRIDYYRKVGSYQAWETFLDYVSEEMGFKSDPMLAIKLKIAKGVFFDYPTETSPERIHDRTFDICWFKIVHMLEDKPYQERFEI